MNLSQSLLDCHAIKLSPKEPFTWASGALSPIYCDNRITLSYPLIRDAIKTEFAETIKRKFPQATVIAGVATGGIAHGALVADMLDMPFVYVRSSPKAHGRKNSIEGHLEPESNVVVIEDLISTGGSSITAVKALREAKANVVGLLAIFTYGLDIAKRNYDSIQCPFDTLTNFKELLACIEASPEFTDQEVQMIIEWQIKLNKSTYE